jgi:hypothetical protein
LWCEISFFYDKTPHGLLCQVKLYFPRNHYMLKTWNIYGHKKNFGVKEK